VNIVQFRREVRVTGRAGKVLLKLKYGLVVVVKKTVLVTVCTKLFVNTECMLLCWSTTIQKPYIYFKNLITISASNLIPEY